jgi:hypothetical protein
VFVPEAKFVPVMVTVTGPVFTTEEGLMEVIVGQWRMKMRFL